MFRVIIAGGRDYNNYAELERKMDKLLSNIKDDIVIVCGMARGADTLGEQYGKQRGYKINYFPADWKTFGKSAGYIRNQEMAENADALVAFWDGKSRGTANMIDIAQRFNLRVRVIRYGDRGDLVKKAVVANLQYKAMMIDFDKQSETLKEKVTANYCEAMTALYNETISNGKES
jgi:hypothetical protein